MLEDEPAGKSGRNRQRSRRRVASEAFARWLQCRYTQSNCRLRRHTVSPRDICYII